MIVFSWRQFRPQALVGAAGLLIVAVVLALTGPHLVHVYDTELAACRAGGGQGPACNFAVTGLFPGLQIALNTVVLVIPVLLGMFWGAPLIAREIETGTFRLAWTQSVTRLRWLLVKMGLVGLAAMVVAGALSLLSTWWFAPLDKVNQNRFSPASFGLHGFVPAGYALFAFALGATVGLLVRRTLPAMAVTLVGFIVVRLGVAELVRPHFMSPVTTSVPLSQGAVGFEAASPGSPLQVVANAAQSPQRLGVRRQRDRRGRPRSHRCDRQGDVSQAWTRTARGIPAEHQWWRRAFQRSHLGAERVPAGAAGLRAVHRPAVGEISRPRHVPAGQPILDLPDDGDGALRDPVRPFGRRVRLVDTPPDPVN